MKLIKLMLTAAILLLSSLAFAGAFHVAPVSVDIDGQVAEGNLIATPFSVRALSVESVPWSVLSGVPSDIVDGDGGYKTEGELTALLDGNYVARVDGMAHNLTTTGRVTMGDIIKNATIEVIHSDGFEDLDGVFQINTSISDLWFFPDTAGQGFSINVWEDLGLIFLVWWTYDTERPPEDVTAIFGEPGHRWVTAQGTYNGDTALLDVFLTSGGIFASAEPPVAVVPYGTIEIVWSSCEEGILTYNIPSLGLSGELPIVRVVLENVPACEAAQPQ